MNVINDRIQDLLESVGFSRNDVQVTEDKTNYTLMYPNFMEMQKWTKKRISDEDLLLKIENLIELHYLGVKAQYEMIQRMRKSI